MSVPVISRQGKPDWEKLVRFYSHDLVNAKGRPQSMLIVKKSMKGPVKIFFGQSKIHVRY